MTVLPNKLIIQTIFKTHSHHCKTKSAGDYMVDTYISMKLTLLSDLLFSLSFSTSGTVSIGTVLSMLFVRYLVLLHPSSNIRLLLKPNLYLQWFTLQTNQNEFSIDWWLTHNKGGYILRSSVKLRITVISNSIGIYSTSIFWNWLNQEAPVVTQPTFDDHSM